MRKQRQTNHKQRRIKSAFGQRRDLREGSLPLAMPAQKLTSTLTITTAKDVLMRIVAIYTLSVEAMGAGACFANALPKTQLD